MLSIQQETDQKVQDVLAWDEDLSSLSHSSSSFSLDVSTGDVFCAPVPVKLYLFKEMSLGEAGAENKEKKRVSRVSDDHKKKYENFRQTLVRFFKRNMRKLWKVIQKAETTKRSNITANRIRRAIQKLYSLKELPSNESIQGICDLLQKIDNPDYFECKIANVGNNFKSCNNKYIHWLFETQIIKDLYSLHHSIAKDSYFKILKITDTLNTMEQEKLFRFVENIPYKLK